MISSLKISAFQPLFTYLGQFHSLSPSFKHAYEKNASILRIKKNKYILSPVDKNACLYYLCAGTVRGFIKDGDKDITTWFSFGNEVIGAIRHPEGSYAHSHEYLQALEDCELICIPYAFIDQLYRDFPEAEQMGRKMLAIQYYKASERSILARIPNASDRYERLMKEQSRDFRNVPLKFLSSYLGIRMETLSRIRKKEIRLDEEKTFSALAKAI